MASVFVSSPSEIVIIDARTRSGTITLPLTNSIPYRVIQFKDQYGAFSNSTLTLSTQTGETFDDGTTSKTFSNAFTYVSLYATSTRWMVMNATQTTQQTISSLTVNQLNFGTGAGWIQFGPIQTPILSTIQTNIQSNYTNNLFLGGTSSATTIEFFGLTGAYTNTVLAEVSTGVGTQEFLIFKGSSVSDRIRLQTTGTFVVETGVSARTWNDNTGATFPLTTPAFIVNTLSNVGIQTASPVTALDVAGTVRAPILSTQALVTSSINGLLFGTPVSTVALFTSNTSNFYQNLALFNASTAITSSIIGLGTIGYASTTYVTQQISSFSTSLGSLSRGVAAGGSTISSLYVGSSSNQNFIKFWGRLGEYNNAAIAEQSTGGFTGEILTFKGSSVSDQIRFQTTGAIRFETGVPAIRNINSAGQLAIPTLLMTSGSNIGVLTNNPTFTLDVTGTGRFTTLLSTASLYAGAIYGGVFFA